MKQKALEWRVLGLGRRWDEKMWEEPQLLSDIQRADPAVLIC